MLYLLSDVLVFDGRSLCASGAELLLDVGGIILRELRTIEDASEDGESPNAYYQAKRQTYAPYCPGKLTAMMLHHFRVILFASIWDVCLIVRTVFVLTHFVFAHSTLSAQFRLWPPSVINRASSFRGRKTCFRVLLLRVRLLALLHLRR